jgi:hypothetical protein
MAAIAMGDFDGRAVGVGLPAVAPLHQRDDRRQQLEALLGEAIFAAFALAGFLVGLAPHHSGAAGTLRLRPQT